jgi:hypothetical protein
MSARLSYWKIYKRRYSNRAPTWFCLVVFELNLLALWQSIVERAKTASDSLLQDILRQHPKESACARPKAVSRILDKAQQEEVYTTFPGLRRIVFVSRIAKRPENPPTPEGTISRSTKMLVEPSVAKVRRRKVKVNYARQAFLAGLTPSWANRAATSPATMIPLRVSRAGVRPRYRLARP